MKLYTILANELYLRGHTLGARSAQDKTETLAAINCGCVVALAGKQDPDVKDWLEEGDNGLYIYQPIPDGKTVDEAALLPAMWQALRTIQYDRSVLVHCHAGRNRSALLAAIIVRQRLGISGAEAVRYLRERRPNALANDAFVNYLEGMGAP